MTKSEALVKLHDGIRMQHTSFNPNESIKEKNDRYYWENGNSISCNAFWHYRDTAPYQDGWSEAHTRVNTNR